MTNRDWRQEFDEAIGPLRVDQLDEVERLLRERVEEFDEEQCVTCDGCLQPCVDYRQDGDGRRCVSCLWDEILRLRSLPLVDEPFCACGRRTSECDGSRVTCPPATPPPSTTQGEGES